MAFSAKQVQTLRRQPHYRHIRTRHANGRELTYLEGWYAISEATRIFGFDGWARETIESRCVLTPESCGTFSVVYTAKVRITVWADGATIVREGHGTGEGRGPSPGEVHDIALKAAETDATKRALATFGRPFGRELYQGRKTGPSQQKPLPAPATTTTAPVSVETTPLAPNLRPGFHPDDTTPIPRPSRYYGRRQNATSEHFRSERRQVERAAPVAPSLAPPAHDPSQGRIDKSLLPLPEPKRLRDKAHLKFVASQPCLICGRQPCDPHHVRFAQPRAIGMKVTDEFTVPLCRGHHRQLHQAGNEVTWWESYRIHPLEIAKRLWEQTHPQSAAAANGFAHHGSAAAGSKLTFNRKLFRSRAYGGPRCSPGGDDEHEDYFGSDGKPRHAAGTGNGTVVSSAM